MTIERKINRDVRLSLEAVENFENWWIKKPLNAIRRFHGWPEITAEILTERIKNYVPPKWEGERR